MSKVDKNYHNLLELFFQEGYTYEDPNRKGVNRLEIPSYTFRHEFKDGFPAITTKKLNYHSVVTELIWFLRGDTNIKYLVDNGCNIWNKDAYNYYKKSNSEFKVVDIDTWISWIKECKSKGGDLGPVYGYQWRKWNKCCTKFCSTHQPIDQIQRLIKNLKEKPLATDHIVNAWNVGDLQDMALPPCHYGFQIIVRPLNLEERLDISGGIDYEDEEEFDEILNSKSPKYGFELHWSQRSCDVFLGIPFNIASYATLALILEKIIGYKALAIQGDLKKVHLYDNSLDAVKEQLSRDINKYDKCELKFDNYSYKKDTKYIDIDQFLDELYPENFELQNYKSYSGIRVEMLERDE